LPWKSASASSLRWIEGFFFDLSRWSSGRPTVYISQLRHLRQAIKQTYS
jgi:hypothetical protein